MTREPLPERIDAPVSRSIAHASPLDGQEVALVAELIQFAIETLNDVIINAERMRQRTATLERYRDDARALLERLST